jgi:uncharacterized protein
VRPVRFLLFLLLVLSRSAFALDVPPPPTRWFTDTAGVVNTTDAALLDTKLQNFEQQSGAQFLIYIFPSLQGEAVEDFTIRCVERWKVGQKKYDNGLVLFVFVEERKVRVEVGYGLEGTVTDAFSSRVIREYIAPRFQQNDYAGGLNAAADAIIAKIRGGEAPVPPLQQRGSQSRGGESVGGLSPQALIFIIFILFFFLLPLMSRRRAGCGGCFFPFIFPGGGTTFGGGSFGGGGFGGGGFGGGGGGFSGGGGGFGGGGATGGW